MKKRRTSISITGLICLSSLLLWPAPAAAQNSQQPEEEKEIPFYQGTTIGVDVLGLGKLWGSDFNSAEISLEVNLKNRYIPVVEIGYGTTDAIDEGTDIHYSTSAPYFRIGANYNFFYRKTYLPGYLYGGIRYGFSSFTYDVDGPNITNPTWPETSVPFAYEGMKSQASWAELLAGIKVQVYKRFYMGWSVRYRIRTSIKNTEHTEPWYIPGFGKNSSSNLGVSYNLIYKLPF